MSKVELVQESWRKIEDWLSDNAEHYLEDLSDGAMEGQLEWFKKDTGIILPDEFLESYRIHDGQLGEVGGLFDGWNYCSFSQMYTEWNSCAGLDEEFDDMELRGPVKMRYMSKVYIPFATDFGGNDLGIDQDPAPGGIPGQVINYGKHQDVRYVLSNSLGEFLSKFAEDLVTGQYTLRESGDSEPVLTRNSPLIEAFGQS